MKKIVFLLLLTVSGVFAQADVVKFTAKITNRNTDSLVVFGPQKFKKVLRINKDGLFTDKFSVTAGPHTLYDGVEQTMVYLKNGYDLNLTMDAKQFDESIVYTGKGSKENNFLAQKALADEQFEMKMGTFADETAFTKALNEQSSSYGKMLSDKELDPEFTALMEKIVAGQGQQMSAMYQQAAVVAKLAGAASPTFAYENHKGGTTKLSDFKGKYVYIDNWATWCGPCRAEIPFLQKVEEKYHGKNIEFVSISIDTEKDYDKWKKFVTDKKLGGVQLIADNDWNSQFIKDFGINSIPRFLLIGPDGKVVDANAKRPSDPELQVQLDALLK